MKDFLYFKKADGGIVYLDPDEIQYLEDDFQNRKHTRIHMKSNHSFILDDDVDEVLEMIDDFLERRAREERKKVRDELLKNNDEYWDNFRKRIILEEKTEKTTENTDEKSDDLIEAARTIGEHCRSKKHCAGCTFYNNISGCVLMNADSPDEWGL